MRKVLSVIFSVLLILSAASCRMQAHETEDVAKEEFIKMRIASPEISASAMYGHDDRATGFYLAEDGKKNHCIAVEFELSGKNSFSYSRTTVPEELYDKIYTLTTDEHSLLFVANEECAFVCVSDDDGNSRTDDIRRSSHPYLTAEIGVKTFVCYDENMREVAE